MLVIDRPSSDRRLEPNARLDADRRARLDRAAAHDARATAPRRVDGFRAGDRGMEAPDRGRALRPRARGACASPPPMRASATRSASSIGTYPGDLASARRPRDRHRRRQVLPVEGDPRHRRRRGRRRRGDLARGLVERGRAGRAGAQALHTFGGYGLTTEYDIHLYNLRAKAWPLASRRSGTPARGSRPPALCRRDARRCPTSARCRSTSTSARKRARPFAEIDDFFAENLTPELRAKAHYSWDGHDPGLHKKLAEARPAVPRLAEGDGRARASALRASRRTRCLGGARLDRRTPPARRRWSARSCTASAATS